MLCSPCFLENIKQYMRYILKQKVGANVREVKIGKTYRHFKGTLYSVEGIAKHSETGENYVVYRQMYGNGTLWIRPLEMFLEKVDRNKYPDAVQEYRFEVLEK